jgi:hypothetical protein
LKIALRLPGDIKKGLFRPCRKKSGEQEGELPYTRREGEGVVYPLINVIQGNQQPLTIIRRFVNLRLSYHS